MSIGILTNPDKRTEVKANYFADYFNYYAAHVGKMVNFELENALSLVDKIIFQIDNNIEHCIHYIKPYINHPILCDDEYLKRFETSSAVIYDLQLLKAETKNAAFIQWIQTHPELKTNLTSFREELHDKMFVSSLDDLISYMLCKHDLSEHLEEMQFHTRILVSEFLFRGRNKRDLSAAFTSILSRDLNIFPFPKNITDDQRSDSPGAAHPVHIEGLTQDSRNGTLITKLHVTPERRKSHQINLIYRQIPLNLCWKKSGISI